MTYTKTNWVDGFTPLSAEKLNNIENGIENLERELAIKINKNDIVNNLNDNMGVLKLPNKVLIQTGTINYNSSNVGWQKGYTVCTLKEPFEGVDKYVVLFTSLYGGGATDMHPTLQKVDDKSFNVYIRNLDNAIPVIPVSIGYIAIGAGK
ncbi:hypothetical protein ACTQ4K_19760 [Clostridium sporogenes]|uniref:hypothetical protein n=2 Tax=Clostridium sporogenes TaxID=1509 RepID=UPI003F9240BE